MHISQFKDSKFLRKEDCGAGILVTIEGIRQENVAPSGQPEEMKFCLTFKEDVKPMVINTTNAALIAGITGSEDTDGWHGHKIVLFTDPNVSYAGKVIGGIRVRAPKVPKLQTPQPAAPAPAPAPPTVLPPPQVEDGDDVPF